MRLNAHRRLIAKALFLAVAVLPVQAADAEWRHIGNAAFDAGLASLATGPVDRVWYSPDGTKLFAATKSGRTFETDDFEQWKAVTSPQIPPTDETPSQVVSRPDAAAKIRSAFGASRLYALTNGSLSNRPTNTAATNAAFRSDDGGASWSNLSMYKGSSLLGAGLADIAASPRDVDELVVAGQTGVWRSLDGGLSWSGLNQFLPNLPVRHIRAVPSGTHGLRISAGRTQAIALEWIPGEKSAWQVIQDPTEAREDVLKSALSQLLGSTITAVAGAGTFVYAGSSEGQIWASADMGVTWTVPSPKVNGPVESIFINTRDGRIALAALATHSSATQAKPPRVLRTMNSGIFWDDSSANLPDVPAHGITADLSSGAIYVATDGGVFLTVTDLTSAGRSTAWVPVTAPVADAPAMDVKLDSGGNQLFVALEGHGVYATIAPHRLRDIRVVSAADFSSRPAAPGGLLSVIGARVQSAQTATSRVPVLDANDSTSQIQVPFDAKGTSISLSFDAQTGHVTVGLPLQSASPAIFVDPEGAPMILDAESGILLDGSKPAHSKSRIQILATGLGRVTPEWAAGIAAPQNDPPKVQGTVRVFLDKIPLEVSQAVLAPKYIGFYLVEVELPSILNEGPADLYVEVDGQASNHVRLTVAQ